MKVLNYLFPLLLFSLLSCGGDSGSSSKSQRENQSAEGEYRIIFQTINPQVVGNKTTGTGTITLSDDELNIRLSIIDAPSSSQHIQTVHAPGSCPTPDFDANGDGHIDVAEMNLSEAVINLDADLNSSTDSGSSYPSGVSYHYNEIGSVSKMIKFNLENHVVIIHGAAASTQLPETVASLDNQSNEASLPIACGIIVRVPEE